MLTHCVDDGGKKARSPRRARRKPLKPLRREGRMTSASTCGDDTRVLFYLHTGPRVRRAPGLPRALCLKGGRVDASTWARRRRGNEIAHLTTSVSFAVIPGRCEASNPESR